MHSRPTATGSASNRICDKMSCHLILVVLLLTGKLSVADCNKNTSTGCGRHEANPMKRNHGTVWHIHGIVTGCAISLAITDLGQNNKPLDENWTCWFRGPNLFFSEQAIEVQLHAEIFLQTQSFTDSSDNFREMIRWNALEHCCLKTHHVAARCQGGLLGIAAAAKQERLRKSWARLYGGRSTTTFTAFTATLGAFRMETFTVCKDWVFSEGNYRSMMYDASGLASSHFGQEPLAMNSGELYEHRFWMMTPVTRLWRWYIHPPTCYASDCSKQRQKDFNSYTCTKSTTKKKQVYLWQPVQLHMDTSVVKNSRQICQAWLKACLKKWCSFTFARTTLFLAP